MAGVYNNADTANEIEKVLEGNGYTIKLEKFENHQ